MQNKVTLRPTRRISRGTCRRCGGSGWLLRPKPGKHINFCKCSTCGGHGLRWKLE